MEESSRPGGRWLGALDQGGGPILISTEGGLDGLDVSWMRKRSQDWHPLLLIQRTG